MIYPSCTVTTAVAKTVSRGELGRSGTWFEKFPVAPLSARLALVSHMSA